MDKIVSNSPNRKPERDDRLKRNGIQNSKTLKTYRSLKIFLPNTPQKNDNSKKFHKLKQCLPSIR